MFRSHSDAPLPLSPSPALGGICVDTEGGASQPHFAHSYSRAMKHISLASARGDVFSIGVATFAALDCGQTRRRQFEWIFPAHVTDNAGIRCPSSFCDTVCVRFYPIISRRIGGARIAMYNRSYDIAIGGRLSRPFFLFRGPVPFRAYCVSLIYPSHLYPDRAASATMVLRGRSAPSGILLASMTRLRDAENETVPPPHIGRRSSSSSTSVKSASATTACSQRNNFPPAN